MQNRRRKCLVCDVSFNPRPNPNSERIDEGGGGGREDEPGGIEEVNETVLTHCFLAHFNLKLDLTSKINESLCEALPFCSQCRSTVVKLSYRIFRRPRDTARDVDVAIAKTEAFIVNTILQTQQQQQQQRLNENENMTNSSSTKLNPPPSHESEDTNSCPPNSELSVNEEEAQDLRIVHNKEKENNCDGGDDEEMAKAIDDIRKTICRHYSPSVLVSEKGGTVTRRATADTKPKVRRKRARPNNKRRRTPTPTLSDSPAEEEEEEEEQEDVYSESFNVEKTQPTRKSKVQVVSLSSDSSSENDKEDQNDFNYCDDNEDVNDSDKDFNDAGPGSSDDNNETVREEGDEAPSPATRRRKGKLSKNGIRWPCPSCASSFSRRRDLQKHEAVKHSGRDLQNTNPHWKSVKVTPNKFEYSEKKWPYEKDAESDSFKCLTCEFVAKSQREMCKHIDRLHHLSEKPTCPKCLKSFVVEKRLAAHSCHPRFQRQLKLSLQEDGSWLYDGKWPFTKTLDENDGSLTYKCGTCSARKKTRIMMTAHCREKHADADRFLCTECGLTVSAERFLRAHIAKVHSESSSCLCTECGMSFKSVSSLYSHKRTRHQTITYSCSCALSFSYYRALKKHQLASGCPPHPAKSQPVTCPHCHTEFRNERGFNVHAKTCTGQPSSGKKRQKRQPEREFECEVCLRLLPTFNTYKRHVAEHIGQRLAASSTSE